MDIVKFVELFLLALQLCNTVNYVPEGLAPDRMLKCHGHPKLFPSYSTWKVIQHSQQRPQDSPPSPPKISQFQKRIGDLLL